MCAIIFGIGMARGHRDPARSEAVWLQMLLLAVSLAVSAIPEGTNNMYHVL